MQAFKPGAEGTRPDDDVLASGHESDRRVHRPRNDDQVAANHGAGHHRGAAADDDERAVDRRGAGELHLAEDNEHVAIDPPFNRGRPRDDDDLTHRIAGVERVVLPDAHHLASPGLRVDRRLGGRLGRRFRRRCGRALGGGRNLATLGRRAGRQTECRGQQHPGSHDSTDDRPPLDPVHGCPTLSKTTRVSAAPTAAHASHISSTIANA